MIAISSFRPLDDSPDIALNQLRAKKSWDGVFDGVLYFGKQEQRLNSSRTQFIDGGEWPHMALLVAAAALCGDMACIINSDIWVAPEFRELQFRASQWDGMRKRPGLAYTSRRYQYEPKTFNLQAAKGYDGGFDIFLAYPQVWKRCLKVIPEAFRIGHGGWDAWMLEFMHHVCGKQFHDITTRRLVFHPRHQERRQVFSFATQPIDFAGLPKMPQQA